MDPLGFYDFNHLLKESYCVLSDSGTAAEEGLLYGKAFEITISTTVLDNINFVSFKVLKAKCRPMPF